MTELIEKLKELNQGFTPDDILFIDSETNETTNELISIQVYYNGVTEIFTDKNQLDRLKLLWKNAKAVIIWNAFFDMGFMSSLPGNSKDWVVTEKTVGDETKETSQWIFNLFGCKYEFKVLGARFNRIKPIDNAPPVIDLLKLWKMMIQAKNNGLKAVVKKYLGIDMIPYNKENALTDAYQLQDVLVLRPLWYYFLDKVSTIKDLEGYTYEDWGTINTEATCTKRAYDKVYPQLAKWRSHNLKQDSLFGLHYALEQAYNGGLTCALYRGKAADTAWFDIHGSYASVIIDENTDQYLKYTWAKVKPDRTFERRLDPVLCLVDTNVYVTSMLGGLKIEKVRKPKRMWMWSYDVIGLRLVFPESEISIVEAYKPIPMNYVEESLPSIWNAEKTKEEKENGKTTLREFLKTKCNSSYGIKAQREPWATHHTNMAIAGIITSRGRLTLFEMIKTARDMGCDWLYSDTDSICVRLNGVDPNDLDRALNKNIAPYSCGCEFIGPTRILSLKKYAARNGKELDGSKAEDKIKTHGKSVFNLYEDDFCRFLDGEIDNSPLLITQLTANTPVNYERIRKLFPEITNPHPGMFRTNIKTGKTKYEVLNKLYHRIDAKLSIPKNAKADDEFERPFHEFPTYRHAEQWHKDHTMNDLSLEDQVGLTYRDYEKEDELIFRDWDDECVDIDEINYNEKGITVIKPVI